jgi:hypothetical protein
MIGIHGRPHFTLKPFGGGNRGTRGVSLIEFALILPVAIILVLVTIDFGMLVQSRLIISNVSREGGSIASRTNNIDANLTSMLQSSARPLDLGGRDGRIFITRITAGESADASEPTITTQLSSGLLGVNSRIAPARSHLGLNQNVYDHLRFSEGNGTSDISEVTVVEVYYKYRPITPLPNFTQGMLLPDGDGMIIWSKAVF